MSAAKSSHLAALGVFGFDEVEPVVLAALITEDPLLLVGNSGTGKTFLLNSLSEALGLEHRHYNASLIAFDDLVGFPYPDAKRGGVKFLETPATVWGAQSVLIDEISRCKPEHQNRLFSLVHERRIQGIALPKLRFRWAAMNPCSADQDGAEDYAGSEALDPALADRFALFVRAADWGELTPEERTKIAAPAGEGRIADDGGRLRAQIDAWRARFVAEVETCPEQILLYVTTAVTALNGAGIRISPRRSRLMARSLLAASIAAGKPADRLFRRVLDASLPHPCWGSHPGCGGGRRGPPRRLGRGERHGAPLAARLHGRERASRTSSASCSTTAIRPTRARRRSRSCSRPNRPIAPRPSRSRSTRRRRWGACRSARRA